MKHRILFFVLTALFPAFISCGDGDRAHVTKPVEQTETAKTESKPAQPAPEAGNVDQLKAALQGRWKSESEPGVEYEFKDAECIRTVKGKTGAILKVVYAQYPGLTCGTMNKAYRNIVGGVMITGDVSMCLAVQGFTPQRFDFVKMGDVNNKPESWTKL
ncbi:MAG: hypothetical protein KGS48_06025 [Bacteroidetes bacterium]|nr:hypothetical protein [Bacteroidota bacterium]